VNKDPPTARDQLAGEAIEVAGGMIGWDAHPALLALVAIEISAGRGGRLAGLMAQVAALRGR
jgi:hypothetical protein